MELRLWSFKSKLSVHPIKTEAMILTKHGFIGPPPPPPNIVEGFDTSRTENTTL